MLTPEPEYLFNDESLDAVLEQRMRALVRQVEDAEEDAVLNADEDAWVKRLVDDYRIEVPTIRASEIEMEDLGEVSMPVPPGPFRDLGRLRPDATLPGQKIVVHIPFDGDERIFSYETNPRTYSPPRALVRGDELLLIFTFPADRPPDVKGETDRLVANVEKYLGWAHDQVKLFNDRLPDEARRAIRTRRERLKKGREFAASVGIPLRRRDDAPRTYRAEGIVPKDSPRGRTGRSALAQSSEAPPQLEPALADEFYEHIVSVIRAATNAMARSPETYSGWGEEQRRDVLLLMLNTHYEGKAVGEAFNRGGKTDILIREADRNIFIAECKFWDGAKSIGEALDQLFDYTTWHDSKLALVIFVREKGLTEIIRKGRVALEGHEQFVQWFATQEAAEARCEMTWPGDPERRATLHVFFAHTASDGGI